MTRTRCTAGALYGMLAMASTLVGCAGGGAGGGGGAASPLGTPSGVGIVTDAPPVLASSTTGAAAPSVFGALLYPLYWVMDPSYLAATPGPARLGTRTEAVDGSITLTYIDSVGPKRMTFLPGDITDRDADGFAAQRGTFTYVETWADSADGFALQHMRVGVFVFPDLGGSMLAMFAFGHETPVANVPTAGSATYEGQTIGVRWVTTGAVTTGDLFDGKARFNADFSTRTFSGTIDNLVIDPDGASTSLPYTFNASGSVIDLAAVAHAGAGLSSSSPGMAGSGSLAGHFFGPNANEFGGTWQYQTNAGDVRIQGAFGARTDLPLQPDGAFAPRRFAAAGGELPGGMDLDWRVSSPFAPTTQSLPQGFLRRLAGDGSVVVVYTEAGSTHLRTLASGDFSVSTDASRRAQVADFAYLESGLRSADVPFGDTGALLTYVRYGHYWTGATSSPPVGGAFGVSPLNLPFHFGALTPSAAVGAGFRAEYTGLTRAEMHEGTVDGTSGRFDLTTRSDLEGVVTLAADLGSGTLSGKLFGFSSRNGAGSTSFADLAMTTIGNGTVTVVDGALRLSAGLRGLGAPNFSAQLDGSVYGPGGEEIAGTWYGSYAPTSTTSTYFVGGFGAGRAETATSDRLTWNHGVGAYALNQSTHRLDLNAAGAVVTSTDVAGINGTLAPRTDGGYTLALVEAGGTRTISFLGSALKADALESRVSVVTGTYGLTLMEGQGSDVELTAGRTSDLSYMRFGQWAETSHSGQAVAFGLFHAGNETPLAQIPTSGTATYHGSTVGIAFRDDVTTRIFSPLTLNADFGGRTITGAATQFSAVNLGGPDQGAAAFAPFLRLDLNGSISGAGFAGTSSSSVIGVTGTGTFDGKFYGPNAVEAGGTWRVEGPGGTMKAWGSFGATR